jgi:hypothetical protein
MWLSFKAYTTRQSKLPDWLAPPRLLELSLGNVKGNLFLTEMNGAPDTSANRQPHDGVVSSIQPPFRKL